MQIPQTPWVDLIAHIASIEREAELTSITPLREMYNPYWDSEELEYLLHEVSQQALREVDSEMLQSIGSAAIASVTAVNGYMLDLSTIAVLSATIQLSTTESIWMPAQYVSPKQWYQTFLTPADQLLVYSIIGGKVVFKGNSINLVLLQEPDIDLFRADVDILPPAAFDQKRIDSVHQKLQLMDFMQFGRI